MVKYKYLECFTYLPTILLDLQEPEETWIWIQILCFERFSETKLYYVVVWASYKLRQWQLDGHQDKVKSS